MTEIKVERKGTSVWPWIIGLIVVVLLIWALAGRTRANRNGTATGTANGAVATPPNRTPQP